MRGARLIWSQASLLLMLVWGTPQVLAVSCGDVLTEDTVLDNDLECLGTALIVGADDITVDLNGYTVTSLDGLGVGVDITAGYDDVKIENGVIAGFQQAILAREASDLKLEDLSIEGVSGSGLPPVGFGEIAAIKIVGGNNVEIKDSSVSSGPAIIDGRPGPDAILLSSVDDAIVENVDIDGGYVGVHFVSCGEPELSPECPPLEEQLPSTGRVENCMITNTIVGVALLNAIDVTIEENMITQVNQGIRIGFLDALTTPTGIRIKENEIFETIFGILALRNITLGVPPEPISDLVIEENFIHDNLSSGMELVSVSHSRVSENLVTDNPYGISLWSEPWFGNPPPSLRSPSIGNRISENICIGHIIDLFHDDFSTPNSWEENTCQNSYGADIDCGGSL